MKGYLIAGAALCVIAFAMNAGWIPAPGKLETATKPPAEESAPLAVELAPTPAIAPEPAAASTPVAEPAAERTAEAPVLQPAAQPAAQPISQSAPVKTEPQPAHADHAAHAKRHAKPRQ
ncbi:hypothetical protein OGR47_16370 [Methylocystis sp. MJC1]|uniref:hypothetical protein n=1 Tax=Methylocystis sp. MJC1 TaxID=2654282 RepID=UPI0013EB4F8C|nr:hypothetical protein [Methylocystis sp. MJC1]KAF2989555.1 hypothetical protein MJC1_03322 [Methylocystis sp. MJC1]MBU6528531.1 hypothetical protein [Methylocystis sp. MJC1]UZX11427.1 hypothetical protein OGR47_16370 [Methylocystis sp. MJC1]